jgi:hypothetical protein
LTEVVNVLASSFVAPWWQSIIIFFFFYFDSV